MELVKYENNELVVAQEVMEQIRSLYEAKAQFDVLMDDIKNQLLENMEKFNVKSIDNDLFKATYKAPTTRKSVDTQALKAQGIYENFLKESPVKSSVVITLK